MGRQVGSRFDEGSQCSEVSGLSGDRQAGLAGALQDGVAHMLLVARFARYVPAAPALFEGAAMVGNE